ncbi:DUF3102 domain-containing protein [Paenibacillus larvae]|nr:DUF3102 domain-containing protein [Paenibacillus larvae]
MEIRAGRDQAEPDIIRAGSDTKGVRSGIPGVPTIPAIPDPDSRVCTIVYGKPDTSAGAGGEEDRGAGNRHIGAIIVALEGGVTMTKVAEKQAGELSSDLATLTAEINAYKRVAGEAVFEIGRRLKYVKENDLVHGQFGEWLESVGIDWNVANRMMKIVTELDSNSDTYQNIGWQVLYLIATLPPEERTKPHKVPSTGETKTVEDMTIRELREVKAALKAEEKARKEAEERTEAIRDTLEAIRQQPPKTQYVPDPRVSDRLKRYEARYGDIDGIVTDRISNHTEVDGAAAQFADDVQTFLLNYAHLTTFKASFTGISDEAYENYVTSLDALKEFINGMQRVLDGAPRGKAEVIDINDVRVM